MEPKPGKVDLASILPPMQELTAIHPDGAVIFDASLKTTSPKQWKTLTPHAQSWLTRGERVARDSLGNHAINVPKTQSA